jgi:hypothetical protein
MRYSLLADRAAPVCGEEWCGCFKCREHRRPLIEMLSLPLPTEFMNYHAFAVRRVREADNGPFRVGKERDTSPDKALVAVRMNWRSWLRRPKDASLDPLTAFTQPSRGNPADGFFRDFDRFDSPLAKRGRRVSECFLRPFIHGFYDAEYLKLYGAFSFNHGNLQGHRLTVHSPLHILP